MKSENIKFYPKSYSMSDEMKRFFTEITTNTKLQEKLFVTDKISDVSDIASDLGFNLKASEVLQAQAGRALAIIDEVPDDVPRLLSGQKPKSGVQWGRGGGGFIDNAGFWLQELASKDALNEVEVQVNDFLKIVDQDESLKTRLLEAKTFNALADLFQSSSFELSAVDLLSHQAQKVLALSEADADFLARH